MTQAGINRESAERQIMTAEVQDAAAYGYLAAAALPLRYIQIPNPVALVWFINHGTGPIPQSVLSRIQRAGNAVRFVQHSLFGFVLWLLPQ